MVVSKEMKIDLLDAARKVRGFAYAPYSSFAVGAALLAKDGKVFCGANVENALYGASICAERAALVKAVSEGAREFLAIAVATNSNPPAFPCGFCRQMLSEFSPKLLVLAGGREETIETSLDILLPSMFGKLDLDSSAG